MRELIVGTRNSKLALFQTKWVINRLREVGVNNPITIKEIVTKGDKRLDVSLPKLGGGGVFLQEIEEDLVKETIDVAVHSLKDIPVVLPEGLKIASIPVREDYRDAYLATNHIKFQNLPKGAVIGTSSLRRAAQLKRQRSDIETKWIRGPIDSRVNQMQEGNYDAIILAVAGIKRLGLGLDLITEYLTEDTFVPAIGQGALAIECRAADSEVISILRQINDVKSEQAVLTERAFLGYFDDGESSPVGGFAKVVKDTIVLHGTVISSDGNKVIEHIANGTEPNLVAKEVADSLISQGAYQMIQEVKEGLE